VRPLELVITALYWWLPVAWWARRNLRVAEESSCDALVLRTLPGRSRDYAESLLKTVEFLSVREHPVPALAVGAAETSRLKERVVMILKRDIPAPLSGRLRWGLVAVALSALFVSPSWVQSKVAPERYGPHAHPTDHERAHELLAVHREELRLEKELVALQAQREEVVHRMQEAQLAVEQARLRESVDELVRNGASEQAEEVRRQLRDLEREAARNLAEAEFRQIHARKEMQLQFRLRELELTREELMVTGKEHLAGELDAKSEAVEQELKKLHLEVLEAEVLRSREELDLMQERLERERSGSAD